MAHVINGLVSNAVNSAIANVTINGYTPGGEQFAPADFNFTTASIKTIIILVTNTDGNPGYRCTDLGGGKLQISQSSAAPPPVASLEQPASTALAFRITLTLFVIGV